MCNQLWLEATGTSQPSKAYGSRRGLSASSCTLICHFWVETSHVWHGVFHIL
jgi:hypothetical protein